MSTLFALSGESNTTLARVIFQASHGEEATSTKEICYKCLDEGFVDVKALNELPRFFFSSSN